MIGRRVISGFVVLLWVSTASAQSLVDSLFAEKEHNFGVVARAAKVEHVFVVRNTTNQAVHLSGVRSSCGCTQPRLGEKRTLLPGEQGEVIAVFNTRSFTGQRSAWLTVTIDQPYYTEVQLHVSGYIRTDVVLNPGQVSFGSVGLGNGGEQKVSIAYAGRSDWKIDNVKTSSQFLEASAVETSRSGGRIGYQLIVKLKSDAPAGYFTDELVLVTNDRNKAQVPVKVEGFVAASLAVSPSPLMLGVVQTGAQVTKQLIIKGTEPFRILEIVADDAGFTFSPSEESKTVHIVPLKFSAGSAGRTIGGKITVKTDLTNTKTAETVVRGSVAEPLAGK